MALEPDYKTQKDDHGYDEKIDISVYTVKLICSEPGCTEIRYIKPQDSAQVKYCKPHTRMHRKAYRAEFMRNKRK